MAGESFLRSLVELATIDSLEALLDAALRLLEQQLDTRARIELWHSDGTRLVRGVAACDDAHCTWIGIRYTLGAICLPAAPADPDQVDLLAIQLAPLAERLLDQDASQRRTIREEIEHVYERRIRDALVRCDWNVSAVARELRVGRSRVAQVLRRRKRRGVLPQDT